MTTAPAQEPAQSDTELITAARGGSATAYAELYNRHRAAAYNLARQLARSPAEADDLVSEAFARLLDTLRGGGGPDSAFRAYLLTALRHCAYDRTRRDRRVELSDDVSSFAPGVPFVDTAVAGLDRTLAAQAFARLPERWQTVLWHTEIEGQSPAEVAPLLGLSPNGVSALAYRAREGLRQEYLQVHLAERELAAGLSTRELERCRAASERLGAWTRGGLSRRETAQVEHHLDECDRCRALAAELADVNGGLRAYVAPLVLGGATAAYLSAGGAKASATATMAGGAAGGAVAIDAATAVPRQLLAIGGSTAALAAAVIVGLIAGPTPPLDSQVAPESSAVVPTRRPARPPTVTTTPPPVTTTTTTVAPPATEPTPNLGRASLTAQGPSAPVELDAGGDPVSLRITVRNNGDAISEPVALTLTLPAGISATGSGFTQAGIPLNWSFGDLFAVSQPGGVTCAGGTGSLRCTTATGLAPGSVASFVIELRAAENATGGTVTGRVTGGVADVSVAPISVLVRPVLDSLDLRARALGSGWHAQLQVGVTNTGPTSGQVKATITLPPGVQANRSAANCTGLSGTITCTGLLGPRQQANWRLDLRAQTQVNAKVTVAARLGRASRTDTVQLQLAQCPQKGRSRHCPPGQGGPNRMGLSAHPVRVQ